MTSLTIGSLQECQSCNCRYFGFLDRCRSGWCQPKVWSTDLVLLKDLHSPWRRDDLNNREALSNYLQKWCESFMDLFSSHDISISIVEFHENFKYLHIPVLLLVAHMPLSFLWTGFAISLLDSFLYIFVINAVIAISAIRPCILRLQLSLWIDLHSRFVHW